MKLDDVLVRLDEEDLELIIGKEIIGTMKFLGNQYLYSENMIKVLKNSYSNEELLLNQTSRKLILESLKQEDAEDLAEELTYGNKESDPYKVLEKAVFKKQNLKILFSFFEETVPMRETLEWIPKHTVKPNYPLYDYQIQAINEIEQALKSRKNRVLLHMPTGSGKTRTTMSYVCKYLIENRDTNVVWFAHTKELLEQADNEFREAWTNLGNRNIEVIKIWDKTSIDITELRGDFIIAGLSKVYNILMNDLHAMSVFASNTSLVIMDEAHMAIAPTYNLLLENMISQNASLIGLSATPGRTWNDPEEDKKLSDFFFRQKVKLKIARYDNPVSYLIDEGYLAKVVNTRLLYDKGIKLKEEDVEFLKKNYKLSDSVLKGISKDKLRNMRIVSKIQKLVERHRRIILFAITKDHSVVLAALLTALGIESFALTSSTSVQDRSKIISRYKQSITEVKTPVILCNYGILTTGFDAPETSCAIIARPTDSLVLYSQMVGRAIRGKRMGGNEKAEIVTVIDTNLAGFDQVADAFINWEDVWED